MAEKAEYEVRSHPPDLVLLDVNILHRNGFEIYRELKSRPATRLIPVVLLTDLAETADWIHGIEAGADEFLTKPIDPVEFRARIRSLMKRKEYTGELDRAEHVLRSLVPSKRKTLTLRDVASDSQSVAKPFCERH